MLESFDCFTDLLFGERGKIAKFYQREQTEEDRQAYSDAEETARENLLGLWKEESAVPPWERRRQ